MREERFSKVTIQYSLTRAMQAIAGTLAAAAAGAAIAIFVTPYAWSLVFLALASQIFVIAKFARSEAVQLSEHGLSYSQRGAVFSLAWDDIAGIEIAQERNASV